MHTGPKEGKSLDTRRNDSDSTHLRKIAGRGAIVLYRFDAEKVEKNCFVPKPYAGLALGGLGAVLALDYFESPIGPFRELVLIPGKFKLEACAEGRADESGSGECRIATKVYVSDNNPKLLLVNTRGISQELAKIYTSPQSAEAWALNVADSDSESAIQQDFCSLEVEPIGPVFPLSSSIVPLNFLADHVSNRFRATVSSKAIARLASLSHAQSDPIRFLDFDSYSPLACIYLDSFTAELPLLSRNENRISTRSLVFHS